MIVTDVNILNQKSDPADQSEVDDIINQLEIELSNHRNGVGLAAVQIGILKRVAIIRVAEYKLNLVNCSISKFYQSVTTTEGCLSFPMLLGKKQRFNQIVISDNYLGNVNNFCAYGLVAVCCQHELDHFDGITIKD